MDHFWPAVEPMITAARAKTVVEVGCEYGLHTQKLLGWAATHGATVHAVDPEPRFDVARFEREYPERFVMHETASLEALPSIHEPDVVLLDGDHNWYTVIHELRLLEQASRWPLTFLHDVGWPYGRRDMYYDPDAVPAEHRQPYERSGLVPGASSLSPDGLNSSYAHATHEGGPRNGVLTAVEDFLDESRHTLHLFMVFGEGGMALLVDHAHLTKPLGRLIRQWHHHDLAVGLSPDSASRYFEQTSPKLTVRLKRPT